jgi:hypothetical protein
MKFAQKHVNNNINRSATEASQSCGQNQFAQIVNNSKVSVTQRDLIAGFKDSPRMLAQRRQIESYLGSGQQQTSVQAYPNNSLPLIQAKLTIGQPADKYEQEADRVAAQVVEQINAPSTKSTHDQSVQREALAEKKVLQRCETGVE